MLLVANLANTRLYKNPEILLKPNKEQIAFMWRCLGSSEVNSISLSSIRITDLKRYGTFSLLIMIFDSVSNTF